MMAVEKLVTIATYLNVTEAHIVKGLLESEGIQVFIYDEQATIHSVNLMRGVRIVVKDSDAEKAKAIIDKQENQFD